jgi:hypothetical protein
MFVSMHIAYFIALYTSQSFSQHKLRKTPAPAFSYARRTTDHHGREQSAITLLEKKDF